MNITVAALNGKAPFELVYGENVIVPLDHLTGATQFSRVQAAEEMIDEVSWLVNVAKIELEIA